MSRIEEIKTELKQFDYIKFEPKYHSYFGGRRKFGDSVTKRISRRKKPFDAAKWARIKAEQWGMQAWEVRKMWTDKGQISADRGKKFHKYAENFYFGIDEEGYTLGRYSKSEFESEKAWDNSGICPDDWISYGNI